MATRVRSLIHPVFVDQCLIPSFLSVSLSVNTVRDIYEIQGPRYNISPQISPSLWLGNSLDGILSVCVLYHTSLGDSHVQLRPITIVPPTTSLSLSLSSSSSSSSFSSSSLSFRENDV